MNRLSLAFRITVLLTLLLAQVGCATSDADLDYTREKPQDNTKPDQSYHGWSGQPD
jgi:hypothetical protein